MEEIKINDNLSFLDERGVITAIRDIARMAHYWQYRAKKAEGELGECGREIADQIFEWEKRQTVQALADIDQITDMAAGLLPTEWEDLTSDKIKFENGDFSEFV